jgi:hypothetical protein
MRRDGAEAPSLSRPISRACHSVQPLPLGELDRARGTVD